MLIRLIVAIAAILFIFKIYNDTLERADLALDDEPVVEDSSGESEGWSDALSKGRRNPARIIREAKRLADDYKARQAMDEEYARAAEDGDYSAFDKEPVEPEDGWSAIEYAQNFAHVHCGPDTGFVVKCSVRNDGEYDISYLEVEIRYSVEVLDGVDHEKSGYEPYRYELDGPFPSGERITLTKDMPDVATKWISSRTNIIDATF